jgi:hypothetical protein
VLAGPDSNRGSAYIAGTDFGNGDIPTLKLTSKKPRARNRFGREAGQVLQHGARLHVERGEDDGGWTCLGGFGHRRRNLPKGAEH